MIIMVLTATSVAMSVFVIQIHSKDHRKDPVPQWFYTLTIKYIARLVCMSHCLHKHQRSDSHLYIDGSDEQEKPLSSEKDYGGRNPISDDIIRRVFNCKSSSNVKAIPIDKSTNFITQHDSCDVNNVNNNSENSPDSIPWVRQGELNECGNHVTISGDDVQEFHACNADLCKKFIGWPEMSEIWDRFFLWVELIFVALSTFCLLILIPLFKNDDHLG